MWGYTLILLQITQKTTIATFTCWHWAVHTRSIPPHNYKDRNLIFSHNRLVTSLLNVSSTYIARIKTRILRLWYNWGWGWRRSPAESGTAWPSSASGSPEEGVSFMDTQLNSVHGEEGLLFVCLLTWRTISLQSVHTCSRDPCSCSPLDLKNNLEL